METLGVQSDIGRRYNHALDRMEAPIRAELAEAEEQFSWVLGRSSNRGRISERVQANSARRARERINLVREKLARIQRARDLMPMVEAGLMTAAEAMKSVMGEP